MQKKNHLLLVLGMMMSLGLCGTCFAEPEADTDSVSVSDTEEEPSSGEVDKSDVERYEAYLASLEAEEGVLTPEEEAAGYVLIDGQKYSPEEITGDSGSEDVHYGSVQASADTGYITFVASVPEYIHEEAYVNIINMNTYKLYGCKLYEVNGYSAQLCVPAGIYMINEGGLSADTVHRFYVNESQFQVKSGSQQTVVFEIVDLHPELAEDAYRETSGQEESAPDLTEETAWEEIGDQENFSPEPEAAAENEHLEEPGRMVWYKNLALTVAFTGIPAVVLYLVYRKMKKKQRGFYD